MRPSVFAMGVPGMSPAQRQRPARWAHEPRTLPSGAGVAGARARPPPSPAGAQPQAQQRPSHRRDGFQGFGGGVDLGGGDDDDEPPVFDEEGDDMEDEERPPAKKHAGGRPKKGAEAAAPDGAGRGRKRAPPDATKADAGLGDGALHPLVAAALEACGGTCTRYTRTDAVGQPILRPLVGKTVLRFHDTVMQSRRCDAAQPVTLPPLKAVKGFEVTRQPDLERCYGFAERHGLVKEVANSETKVCALQHDQCLCRVVTRRAPCSASWALQTRTAAEQKWLNMLLHILQCHTLPFFKETRKNSLARNHKGAGPAKI
jgi:hypothetical protein